MVTHSASARRVACARSRDAALRRSSRSASIVGRHQPRAKSDGPGVVRAGQVRTGSAWLGLRRAAQISVDVGEDAAGLHGDRVGERADGVDAVLPVEPDHHAAALCRRRGGAAHAGVPPCGTTTTPCPAQSRTTAATSSVLAGFTTATARPR
jgi:hypothetical protein